MRAGPRRSGGSRGSISADISGKTGPKISSQTAFKYPDFVLEVWRDFWGCRETALEFVCGADFSWTWLCGPGPGDLGGSRGVDFGRHFWETRAENLQPDCLQVSKHMAEINAGILLCRTRCRRLVATERVG